MEGIFIQVVIFVVLFPVLFVVTIPIHEIWHFLFAKAMGCQNELEITFLKIGYEDGTLALSGEVSRKDESEPWSFSTRFPINYKAIIFLLGLSGGFGVALIISSGFLLLLLVPQLGVIVWKPLAVIVGFHVIFGIIEGRRLTKKWNF